mmetsp:Transcript_21661/g.33077  ORF Transcript_21661/g.33077 Transcript_21661/m.33077 type:complete len:104 (+) Transcript_21661:1584-1895(+)
MTVLISSITFLTSLYDLYTSTIDAPCSYLLSSLMIAMERAIAPLGLFLPEQLESQSLNVSSTCFFGVFLEEFSLGAQTNPMLFSSRILSSVMCDGFPSLWFLN